MGSEQFTQLVKKIVAEYANEHLDKTDGKKITEDDVFIFESIKSVMKAYGWGYKNCVSAAKSW